MERYETLFAQLKKRKEGAFVPFVTLGDPGVEQSLKIIDALIEAGADALELGIPFSDPLADGPTIHTFFNHFLRYEWAHTIVNAHNAIFIIRNESQSVFG